MRWTRFFLVLFLLPTLIYASFDEEDCSKLIDKMRAEWERHSQLIEEAGRLGPNQDEHVIHRLREAIACCQRAIGYCNKILDKIAHKSKKERHADPWPQIKKDRERDKKTFTTEINELQNVINNIPRNRVFEKANFLYQESLKKAELAKTKYENCPRHWDNVEDVVYTLREISKLYEEALSLAQEALQSISPYSDEEGNNTLRQVIEVYQQAIHICKKEADEWPSTVLKEEAALKEQLETSKDNAIDSLTEQPMQDLDK